MNQLALKKWSGSISEQSRLTSSWFIYNFIIHSFYHFIHLRNQAIE